MADEFSYLTDSEDERAVEDVLSQAMDHTVLEQIAAINCSSFSTSDNLPFDLENRFRKLKSLPSTPGSSRQPSKSKSFKPRSSDDSSFERIPDLKNCSPEDPEEYSGRNQNEIKGTDSRSKLKSSSNSNKFCETESIKSKSKSKSRTTGSSESSSSTDDAEEYSDGSKPKSSSNRKENRKTKSLKLKSRTGSSESSSSTDDAEEYSDGSNSRSKPKSSSNRKENRKPKSLKLKSRTGSNSRSKPKSSSNRKDNRKTKSLKLKLKSRTGSSPESGSVSPARRVIGCLWCSPKKEKRKQGKENRLSSFSSSWGNEYDVDFLKTFSMKEQNRIMKKAIKEEEKINKEAEKIVKWAEQASSRMMDVSGFESLDDELTDHEI